MDSESSREEDEEETKRKDEQETPILRIDKLTPVNIKVHKMESGGEGEAPKELSIRNIIIFPLVYYRPAKNTYRVLSDCSFGNEEKEDLMKQERLRLHIPSYHKDLDVNVKSEDIPKTFSVGFHRLLAMDRKTLSEIDNESLWSILSAGKRFFTDPSLKTPLENFTPVDIIDVEGRRISRVLYLAGNVYLVKAHGRDAVFMGMDILEVLKYFDAKEVLFSYRPQLFCAQCHKKSGIDGLTLSQCSQCKTAHYCSRECQSKHWQAHKQLCVFMKQKQLAHLGSLHPPS